MDSLSTLQPSSLKSAYSLNEALNGPLSRQLPSAYSPGAENDSSQSPGAVLETAVGKAPGSFVPASVGSGADFSPQAVADRIVAYVDNAIARRAGSELEVQSMLEQAREGISQGINDARASLEALGELSAGVAEQIDETESLVFQGLDRLQQALMSNRQEGRFVISEAASLSSQFQQTREASIEIVTRDGDRVAVSYSAFVQASASQSYSATAQGQAFVFEYSAESASAFQFSVQGELDSAERESINELLNDVADIAGQFFQGDVQAAFNASLELGFDSEQLKRFSVDLQQNTRVQVVETYQRTEQMPGVAIQQAVMQQPVIQQQSANVAPASVPVNPRPAVDVLSQLDNLLERVKEAAIIEEPENTLKSILGDMLDSLNEVFDSPVQSYIKGVTDIYHRSSEQKNRQA